MIKDIEATLRAISVKVLQDMAGREEVIKGLRDLMPSGGIDATAEEVAKNEVSIAKPLARQKMLKFLQDWYKGHVAGVRGEEDVREMQRAGKVMLGSFIIFSMCEHLKWDAILNGLLAIANPTM